MTDKHLLRQQLKTFDGFFALGFGSGLSPYAPGTMGTLVAIPIYILMAHLGTLAYCVLLTLMAIVGVYLCQRTTERLKVDDHPAIVWDEIVGYGITMAFAPMGWFWISSGFLLFRFFDIVKPWPISWLDKRVKGGFGIMVDDVLAGIFAAGVLGLIQYFGIEPLLFGHD